MKEVKDNQKYLENLIGTSISQVKNLAETNTIVGNPIISPNGSIIIPISKLSVGYVVGAGEFNSTTKKLPYPLTGGSGGGVSLVPIGFIIENNKNEIKFIDVEDKNSYQTILNFINTIINKINIKNKEKENENK